MDDDALEQQMRAGLGRRADEARVDVAVVDRARRAAGRRRTSRLAVLGAAAAVVVATVTTAAIVGGDDDSTPGVADSPSVAPTSAGAPTDAVRTESWGDVTVEVPIDWGFGSAPTGTVGDAMTCYPGASLTAVGEPASRQEERSLPYVGRPIVSTDLCVPYPDNRPDAPATDYVWLGAAVAPGVVELDNGLVQETVAVAGTTVTAATTDPELRRQILDSVAGGERCLSSIDRSGPMAHDEAADPDAEPVTLRVCAYRLDEGRPAGDWQLTYAVDVEGRAVSDYLEAVAAGEPATDQCPTIDYQLLGAVLLELLDADGGVLRQDAVNPFDACGGIAVGASRVWELDTTRLTPAMTRPWVVGGVGAVVSGGAEFGFIGPQG